MSVSVYVSVLEGAGQVLEGAGQVLEGAGKVVVLELLVLFHRGVHLGSQS